MRRDAWAEAPAPRPRRAADAHRADARDAAAEVARAADLRVRPALVGRVRDRVGARRARRGVGSRRRTSSSRSRSRSPLCSRSSSSRTARPFASTRRAAARTSSRGRTSERLRASSPPRRSSPITSSPSRSRSRQGSSRSRRSRRRCRRTRSGSRSLCLLLIVLANLRGVRESGLLFALPTYAFVDVDPRCSSASGSCRYATGAPSPRRRPAIRCPPGPERSLSSSSCARSRPARPR